MEKIPIRHITATQKEPDLSESFSIRNLQALLAEGDMVQELHRHDFYYILFLEKGAGSHDIDFTSYTISENSVFFMRPGQVHELELKSESTGYLLQFSPEFYYPLNKVSKQLLRNAGSTNYYKFSDERFKKLLSVLNYIFQEYSDREEKYLDIIKANMGVLFLELIRGKDKDSSDDNFYMQGQLDKFTELLETHVFENKQVSQYAAMLNLSAYQLNAITKATLGKTCSELINEHIILEAKRCLLATSNQINQIAYRLGYEDVSYFIRFFKQHTGHSPEVFRNNFK